jgi:hypothetical protein
MTRHLPASSSHLNHTPEADFAAVFGNKDAVLGAQENQEDARKTRLDPGLFPEQKDALGHKQTGIKLLNLTSISPSCKSWARFVSVC